MDTISKINSKAQKWLETNPFLEMGVSHDESWTYDIMTTNMSNVFNNVLKRDCSLPVTTLV